MLTDQHPITPPPELVEQIRRDALHGSKDQLDYELRMIHIAFRSGADQELEACREWASQFNYDDYRYQDELRAARRPKPPSLAEEALTLLDEGPVSELLDCEVATIRAALKRLQQLEKENNDN